MLVAQKPSSWYAQSGVLAYLDEPDGRKIVLVTSTKKSRWVIPKGVVEAGMHPADSAVKEAFEEAGVSGQVARPAVGRYTYPKWGGTCSVDVFALVIKEVVDRWPESSVRDRRFVLPEEACRLLREPALKAIIRRMFDLQ
jgi:8-oxo-dGTP pyrophosphatase MutT (NUDIX family)